MTLAVSSGGRDSDHLMSVAVTPSAPGAPFSYGTPKPLFDVSPYSFPSIARTYDISADGSRFLLLRRNRTAERPRDAMTIIVHWAEELRAKLGSR